MNWDDWKEQTFGSGYMIWHDGLDTSAVTCLRGQERDEALAMLRLGDAESIASMKSELEKATGTSRVRLALSIHALAPDPSLARYLVDVLHSTLYWTDRIEAAIGLRHFSGPDDEQALLESVEADPEYLVRNHASESLLIRWKIEPHEISKHEAIFKRICGAPSGEPNSPEHVRGFVEARAMLEKLKLTSA